MSDTLPTRISLAEIEKKKDEFPMYAVLPIPPFGENVPFETIGRSTFKKYIRQTYDRLQSRNELPASGYCTHIPFVILQNCKEPYVVRTENEPKKTPVNALIKPGTSLSKPANIANENVTNMSKSVPNVLTKSNVKSSDIAPSYSEYTIDLLLILINRIRVLSHRKIGTPDILSIFSVFTHKCSTPPLYK